jgi:hypothetical protein
MLWIGILLAGSSLALLNVRGTLRVWRSGVYERGQLLAQTALIWVVPGSVFAVMYVLKDERSHRAFDDPTATNSPEPTSGATTVAGGGAP